MGEATLGYAALIRAFQTMCGEGMIVFYLFCFVYYNQSEINYLLSSISQSSDSDTYTLIICAGHYSKHFACIKSSNDTFIPPFTDEAVEVQRG